MPVMIHYDTVDDYIAAQAKELQPMLQQLRKTIKELAPSAEESISYCMPAYKYMGRPLVYFAAQQKHIGFYALPLAVEAFKNRLKDYSISKGTLRLPLEKPLPLTLIKDMVKFRLADNESKAQLKKAAKKERSISKEK